MRSLAEQFAKDPHRAAWFAIGAAQEALAQGNPERAGAVLDAATEMLQTRIGRHTEPVPGGGTR
jgi:hypothetical protein